MKDEQEGFPFILHPSSFILPREESLMPPGVHIDPSQVDCSVVVAGREEIRRANPQRFEMEQLDAIVHIDRVKHLLVGYKDVHAEEFWVRGHMPGYPLLPGVLMCEAAAQLSGYYCASSGMFQADFIGFGGLENVRFRDTVHPGDRLLLVAKGIKFHRRQAVFNVQGFVGTAMVFHADIIGIPMMREPVQVEAGET
jgi:3-hydroxyacyl-[acyl-carrier-protein] dehydratase